MGGISKPKRRHGWVEHANKLSTLTGEAEFSSIAETLGRQWIISGSRKQITRSLWLAFTNRTEWSVTPNSMLVAAVALYAPGDGDLGDLE